MAITEAQSQPIEPGLPRPRGHVRRSNRHVLHAFLSVAEPGGQWRGLPPRLGHGQTLDTRRHRWSKSGGLDRVCETLQPAQIVRVQIEAGSLDRTLVQGPPDGTGAGQQTARPPSASPEADGPPRCLWWPRLRERP